MTCNLSLMQKCDPYSSDLFTAEAKARKVLVLCSNGESNDAPSGFCNKVWNTCQHAQIQNSPFSAPISPSKLADQWNSSTEFCRTMGGESICFNGTSVSFKNTVDLSPPQGIRVEKIGDGSYSEDGSFHPNFTKNGCFCVSFNCDKAQMASCSGRCSCNSEAGCDPSKVGLVDGAQICRYQSVVSEFTVNSSSTTPSEAKSANPSEVRRIFTTGLPYTGHHAGQILFGPEDGYLYFMMGDGGNKGDPFNFAQNKKSVLGKIMRLDVNQIPNLYGEAMWAVIENPQNSGIYNSTKLPFACAKDSPIACEPIEDSSLPSLGILYSFAEDNEGEIYVLSSKGVYRIVRPSRCNYACASESRANIASPPRGTSSSTTKFVVVRSQLMLFLSSVIILFSSI